MSNSFKFCFILLISLLTFLNVQGQSRNSYERKKEKGFIYIVKSFDHTFLKYIKTFQCVSKEGDDIPGLLRAIRIQAENAGANCFRFKSFTRNDSTGIMTLTLDTYYASQQQLDLNTGLMEKNAVYIISDDKYNDKIYSFQINGEKISLKSGSYHKYIIPIGTEVKINNGGITGSTLKINWDEDNPSRFLVLSGFELAENPYPSPTTGIGVGFTTGKLKDITTNLGMLLTDVLQAQQ